MVRQFRTVVMVCVGLVGVAAQAQDTTQSQGMTDMGMKMDTPNGPLNMKMQVRQTTTTTTTTTTQQDGPPPPPSEPPQGRDCGTGNDPGCSMMRAGEYPMDADTFHGLIDSLKATANEIERHESADATFKSNWMTAKQLGLVLDLFDNEITRFDVAKAAAHHVVDPGHALRHSTKFKNSIYATDYTKLMAAQQH